MEDAFQDFDVVVIEVGNHYPAWEHHNFTSQLHRLLAHDQLRRACMQRACVLASAPASHFAGGVATYSSYVRAQEDCLAHKFATACGGVDDAHFRGSHEAQQASMLQAVADADLRRGGARLSVLRLFDLTVGWPELHPGYRRNRHSKLCDCLHYCYDERMWEPIFSSLARLLPELARPALGGRAARA